MPRELRFRVAPCTAHPRRRFASFELRTFVPPLGSVRNLTEPPLKLYVSRTKHPPLRTQKESLHNPSYHYQVQVLNSCSVCVTYLWPDRVWPKVPLSAKRPPTCTGIMRRLSAGTLHLIKAISPCVKSASAKLFLDLHTSKSAPSGEDGARSVGGSRTGRARYDGAAAPL